MNLLERLIEKTLTKSPLLIKIVTIVEKLATEVYNLDAVTMELADQIKTHHQVLQELYARQDVVTKAIKSNSLNMKMPGVNDKEPAKPN